MLLDLLLLSYSLLKLLGLLNESMMGLNLVNVLILLILWILRIYHIIRHHWRLLLIHVRLVLVLDYLPLTWGLLLHFLGLSFQGGLLLLELLAILTRFFLAILLLNNLVCHFLFFCIFLLYVWILYLFLDVLDLRLLSLTPFVDRNLGLSSLCVLIRPLFCIDSRFFSVFAIYDTLVNSNWC
jgi:hypothetical protein